MDKWEHLANVLRVEHALLGLRIEPHALRKQYEAELGWIIEESGRVIACTFLWNTDAPGWFELGTVWSSPEYRGRGLGAAVFRMATKHIVEHRLRAFLITHNPRIVHLAESERWIEATRETWGVVPWVASCEPCDRLPAEQKNTCPLRAGSACRMFFITCGG